MAGLFGATGLLGPVLMVERLPFGGSRQMARQAGDRARKYGWKLGKLLARHVKMLEAATMELPGRGLKGLKYARWLYT